MTNAKKYKLQHGNSSASGRISEEEFRNQSLFYIHKKFRNPSLYKHKKFRRHRSQSPTEENPQLGHILADTRNQPKRSLGLYHTKHNVNHALSNILHQSTSAGEAEKEML
ncbi:hypothetical protein LOAG_11551 [Loa loa]|uniref:Uncharacterized protein n=1 Tax=Loa loa TaxID=7209 RepID=A0A1S0TPA8_LOALO|nr:hypothetical protein LOAG_11551 [Loa loa]EFO16954.1 hypothetical protein LOAG_11551 [Loa loa]